MALGKKKAVHKFNTNLLNKVAKEAKERDKWKCRICGYDIDKRFIHAHHILGKADYPQLAYVLSNLISVCLYCHATHFHKTFISFVFKKPKNVTKKDLIKFLEWHKLRQSKESNTMAKTKKEDKKQVKKDTKMPMKEKDMPMKGKMPTKGKC